MDQNKMQLYVTDVTLGYTALNDFQREVIRDRGRFDRILVTDRDKVIKEIQEYVDDIHTRHKACKALVTNVIRLQISETRSFVIVMPNGNLLLNISFVKIKKCAHELVGTQIQEGGRAWKI